MISKLLRRIQIDLGLPPEAIDQIIHSAPMRYKVYKIRKKSGEGYRTIAQPAREVKLIQRWVIREVLSGIAVSDVATAYREGSGIKANALAHSSNSYLTKLDFKDYFPSILVEDFIRFCADEPTLNAFDAEDINRLGRLFFWKPRGSIQLRLSIGAPSSPILSNILMRSFDERIVEWCKESGVVYTRYADDMVFSTNQRNLHDKIIRVVRKALKAIPYPRLVLNEEKTLHCSKAGRRVVTGIIVTNDEKLSLGRDRKRIIRSKVHRFTCGLLDDDQANILRGELAFAHDIEPDFVISLRVRHPSCPLLEFAPPSVGGVSPK